MFSARTTVRSSEKDLGIRIYIDEELVIDQWNSKRHWDTGISKKLTAGESYKFRVEYVEDIDWAAVSIGWKPIDDSLLFKAVELAKQSELVILVLGSNNGTEEELHDRISLDLLPEQKELAQKIFLVNPNILLVLVNGSPISINWSNKNIPAILEAWYPGQEGGNAIADIIFGDYNPDGKLPITFYKGVDQLPDFYDYDITKGRTYMYQKEEPLYSFGYGLSYTEFVFSDFSINNTSPLYSQDSISVSVKLRNSGGFPGAEVIQLYVHENKTSIYNPIKQLKGFQKVFLDAGQEKVVIINVLVSDLATFDIENKIESISKGNYYIMIGNSSDNIIFKEIETISGNN